MSAIFEEGDVVRLKSGGQKMTIHELGKQAPYYHECAWFDKNGEHQFHTFKETALKKYDDSDAMPVFLG